jgi:uncharacterized protein YlxW (UPF0749 family)
MRKLNSQNNQKILKRLRVPRLILFLACVLLGLITVLQYKSLRMTKEEKFIDGKTTSDLAADYIILHAKNQELLERNQLLTRSAADIYSAQNDEGELKVLMTKELQMTRKKAGLAEASGEGIEVTITPSESVPITANMMIQFINELKAAGAKAIAINDQRVVPMTEIRDTYTGYTVNGELFFYENAISIRAIGNNVDIYNSLRMVGGILDKWEESNIDVHVDIVDNLIVPALDSETAARMDLAVLADNGQTEGGE